MRQFAKACAERLENLVFGLLDRVPIVRERLIPASEPRFLAALDDVEAIFPFARGAVTWILLAWIRARDGEDEHWATEAALKWHSERAQAIGSDFYCVWHAMDAGECAYLHEGD